MRSKHKMFHTGEKPAICNLCQKWWLLYHSHALISFVDTRFSFTSNGHLNVHIRSHLKSKNYECNECKRRFYTEKDLKIHVTLHTNERPYVCTTCNKGFNRLNNMTKHMRLHMGIKPYECDVCKLNYFSFVLRTT